MKYILFILISINLFADYEFGIKGGFNINGVDKKYNDYENEKTELDMSYNFGVFLKNQITDYFYISGEMLYNRKGFVSKGGEGIYYSEESKIIKYPFGRNCL